MLFKWVQKADREVILSVFDLQGSITITLPLGQKNAGEYSKSFATAALSEGTYLAPYNLEMKSWYNALLSCIDPGRRINA